MISEQLYNLRTKHVVCNFFGYLIKFAIFDIEIVGYKKRRFHKKIIHFLLCGHSVTFSHIEVKGRYTMEICLG